MILISSLFRSLGSHQSDGEISSIIQKKEQHYLPPPNPILNHSIVFESINTALKVQFKPLPSFQKTEEGFQQQDKAPPIKKTTDPSSYSSKRIEEISNDENNQQELKTPKESESLKNEETIFSLHYQSIKAQLVYRKFDNTNSNFIPYSSGKRYFAGYFCNVRDIIEDTSGKKYLLQQNTTLKNSGTVSSDEETLSSRSENKNIKNQTQSQFEINSLKSDNPSFTKDHKLLLPVESSKKHGDLQFDSNFESGNLFAAFKINEKEYDLILQNDINSKGNTQWFFFKVQNNTKNQIVRFNIVNLIKNDSLFNYGMKPVVFSEKSNEGNGWIRDGNNVTYSRCDLPREGCAQKNYYKLSFTYKFNHEKDVVYFAHCFPYTYSDLQTYSSKILSDPQRKIFVSKKLLCQTIAKNKCDIYTITAPLSGNNMNQSGIKPNLFKKRPKEIWDRKKYVFLTGRQHPGESASSFMIQGAMDFLTDPVNEEAAFLREHFIFKVIPMMNPDGVIHGNYRCSLSGVDLNRQWETPSKLLHPTVYYAKASILKHQAERPCRFLCDFHGHSKKMNSFFYGNKLEEDPFLPKIIPIECSLINSAIDFKSSTFHFSKDKDSTFRQALFQEMDSNPYIYTFEASFFGSSNGQKKSHFTVEDLKGLGRDIMRGLFRTVQEEVLDELDRFKISFEPNSKESLNPSNSEIKPMIKNKSNYQEQMKSLIEIQGVNEDQGSNSGSDSNPSEDELSKKELKKIYTNKKISSPFKKNRAASPSQRPSSKEMIQRKIPTKIKNCIEDKKATINSSENFNLIIDSLTLKATNVIYLKFNSKNQSFYEQILQMSSKEVQTEEDFSLLNLSKYENQMEFFNQLQNSQMYEQYPQQNLNDCSSPLKCASVNIPQCFNNSSINQALWQTNQGMRNSASTNQNVSGRRNLSFNNRPKTSQIRTLSRPQSSQYSSLTAGTKTPIESQNPDIQESYLSKRFSSLNQRINNNSNESFCGIRIQSIQPSTHYDNIFSAYNFSGSNRLFVSGMNYGGTQIGSTSAQKMSAQTQPIQINRTKKTFLSVEIQTIISIPIQIQIDENSNFEKEDLNKSNSEETNQQENEMKESIEAQQYFLREYNNNHLNSFSPKKKKQYVLCVRKHNSSIQNHVQQQTTPQRIGSINFLHNTLLSNTTYTSPKKKIQPRDFSLFEKYHEKNKERMSNQLDDFVVESQTEYSRHRSKLNSQADQYIGQYKNEFLRMAKFHSDNHSEIRRNSLHDSKISCKQKDSFLHISSIKQPVLGITPRKDMSAPHSTIQISNCSMRSQKGSSSSNKKQFYNLTQFLDQSKHPSFNV